MVTARTIRGTFAEWITSGDELRAKAGVPDLHKADNTDARKSLASSSGSRRFISCRMSFDIDISLQGLRGGIVEVNVVTG